MAATEPGLLAAIILGLLGSSHCMVMCGGISAALGMGVAPERRYSMLVLFQAGRVATYAILGAGLGALVGALTGPIDILLPALRILSGLLLAAMGLYIANWWPGLLYLEKAGQQLWRHIEPLARRRLPIRQARDALAVGLFWGFLPCGLIYTALAWTSTTANWRESALLMTAFGLGTTPAMLATGVAAQRLAGALKQRRLRTVAALLLIFAGAWTAWIGLQHIGHSGGHPAGHDSSPVSEGEKAHHGHH